MPAFESTFGRSCLAAAFALSSLTLSATARADDAFHVGAAVTAGFSGLGADVGVNINSYLGVRATIAGFSIDHNGNYSTSIDWTARARLFQAGLLLDGYPFAGGFHLTAGLVKDGNKISLTAQPSGSGSFTFNGTSYPAADVASASASVQWNKTVPYLGLGWGNLAGSSGLHFTSDFGLLLTGSPTATITANCSAALIAANGCSQLTYDAGQEQLKLQNDVHKITVWPVARIGIGFAF